MTDAISITKKIVGAPNNDKRFRKFSDQYKTFYTSKGPLRSQKSNTHVVTARANKTRGTLRNDWQPSTIESRGFEVQRSLSA